MRNLLIVIVMVGVIALSACQPGSAEEYAVFCENLEVFNQTVEDFFSLDDDSSPEEIEAAHSAMIAAGHEVDVAGKKLNDPVVDEFLDAASKFTVALDSLPMNTIISPDSTTSLSASMANISQERDAFIAAYETVNQTTCQ